MFHSDLITDHYKQEAIEDLAIAIIKEPGRKKELESNVDKWIKAYHFYREEKVDRHRIESQLRGINFNFPVLFGHVPPPDELVQYQAPTTHGHFPESAVGNYWSHPGQSPQRLGISDYGRLRDPLKPYAATQDIFINVKKTAWQFVIEKDNEKVPALFSIAAPVVDHWSRRASWEQNAQFVSVVCVGGGEQIFSPRGKEIYKLKPNQKPIQTLQTENKLLQSIVKKFNKK